MIIRSKKPTEAFTVISNSIIGDHSLSWKARGLLIFLLSKPDHWTTSAAHLTNMGPDGRDSVRTGLQELEARGYLVRARRQDSRGRWSTVTWVYDTPGHRHPVDNPVGNTVGYTPTENGLSVVGEPCPLVKTD